MVKSHDDVNSDSGSMQLHIGATSKPVNISQSQKHASITNSSPGNSRPNSGDSILSDSSSFFSVSASEHSLAMDNRLSVCSSDANLTFSQRVVVGDGGGMPPKDDNDNTTTGSIDSNAFALDNSGKQQSLRREGSRAKDCIVSVMIASQDNGDTMKDTISAQDNVENMKRNSLPKEDQEGNIYGKYYK